LDNFEEQAGALNLMAAPPGVGQQPREKMRVEAYANPATQMCLNPLQCSRRYKAALYNNCKYRAPPGSMRTPHERLVRQYHESLKIASLNKEIHQTFR
ncbi:hypothetical protein H0H93_006524, partial [Arthromyces matolae]